MNTLMHQIPNLFTLHCSHTHAHLQARRVRAGLADGQSPAELRRLWPYGSQFACDWLTRLEVVRGAAAGLEYMHQHGVIHRDLTSYNLLLDFGKPWQVGFRVVKGFVKP
jgi:serine/threonine protein kinase